MKSVALGASGLAVGLLLAACSFGGGPTANPTVPVSSSTPHASSTGLVDPFTEISDPHSDRFVNKGIEPALHVKGNGPQSYTIPRPANGVRQFQFYVSCSPESTFTLTMTKFYSGSCSKQFSNTGTIPLPPGDGPIDVQLEVPEGVDCWLLAIPIN